MIASLPGPCTPLSCPPAPSLLGEGGPPEGPGGGGSLWLSAHIPSLAHLPESAVWTRWGP